MFLGPIYIIMSYICDFGLARTGRIVAHPFLYGQAARNKLEQGTPRSQESLPTYGNTQSYMEFLRACSC